MKVLITGAAGFIGSHLVEACLNEGMNVKAFVHYNSKNSWGWLENQTYVNEIELITGDVRDFDSVSKAVKGVDKVFHLAALIGIPYSYISPLAYIRTNVEGTYNVLESAKIYNTEEILVTSTSETYGTAQYVPIDEKHPFVGQSPYSATKISADNIALSYYLSFNSPVKIVRPFNTYGPRQSNRAIIPTIISQIIAGKQKIKLGSLHPTRDLTYVKDTVSGFLHISKSKESLGRATNIGMNYEISVEKLFNKIKEIMGSNIEIEKDAERIRPENSEVERLWCNNSQIIQTTGWKPQYSLDQGLIETIQFIKENINEYKTNIYTV